mmetsp:Transcript_101636/g.282863  ORF Transcript_101636/g.282863 Transcript_101636/m.282863 type:complete len:248 (-) Transcript_101636:164-907(-)
MDAQCCTALAIHTAQPPLNGAAAPWGRRRRLGGGAGHSFLRCSRRAAAAVQWLQLRHRRRRRLAAGGMRRRRGTRGVEECAQPRGLAGDLCELAAQRAVLLQDRSAHGLDLACQLVVPAWPCATLSQRCLRCHCGNCRPMIRCTRPCNEDILAKRLPAAARAQGCRRGGARDGAAAPGGQRAAGHGRRLRRYPGHEAQTRHVAGSVAIGALAARPRAQRQPLVLPRCALAVGGACSGASARARRCGP